ncbi:MAG: hypothetical protein V4710_04160 [Verrucomicrobiota bacterium]
MKAQASSKGSVLAVSLMTLGVLAGVVAASYTTLIPRYRSIYQAASWQEAFHGAEAGIDIGINALNTLARSNPDPNAYAWTANGWTFSDATYTINGERILGAVTLGGTNQVAVSKLALDVYTRDTTTKILTPWFRLRSTGKASLPGPWAGADRRDAALRRMNLSSRDASGASTPYVARTVEAIIKPVYRFSHAILVSDDLILGNSHHWNVDSFDSSDPAKSDPVSASGDPNYRGFYDAKERQSNGNGAQVRGLVQTNGGDDPATTGIHENVSGSGRMDQDRIKDDFDQEIPTFDLPDKYIGSNALAPSGSLSATGGPYIFSNLGPFAITPPATAGSRSDVEIVVKGDINLGNGNKALINIPPNVFVTIYVTGNIDLGDGVVNNSKTDSRVAGNLKIYGIGTSGTYTASGNAEIVAAIHAPRYDIRLNGTVKSYGSIVGKSLLISGGGDGGFHYDESLGKGDVASWKVAGYFEDTRADL